MSWFAELHPIWQAFLATCFTWFLTALGSAVVFIFKTVNRKVLDGMLGFAAGVMIAASFWSLLAPAIEMAEESLLPAFIPAAVGFLAGGFFLLLIDKILPHLHPGFPKSESEGIKTSWERSILLILKQAGREVYFSYLQLLCTTSPKDWQLVLHSGRSLQIFLQHRSQVRWLLHWV
jgi:ZIP family zinc transporter